MPDDNYEVRMMEVYGPNGTWTRKIGDRVIVASECPVVNGSLRHIEAAKVIGDKILSRIVPNGVKKVVKRVCCECKQQFDLATSDLFQCVACPDCRKSFKKSRRVKKPRDAKKIESATVEKVLEIAVRVGVSAEKIGKINAELAPKPITTPEAEEIEI